MSQARGTGHLKRAENAAFSTNKEHQCLNVLPKCLNVLPKCIETSNFSCTEPNTYLGRPK